jgi:hypothetical protein
MTTWNPRVTDACPMCQGWGFYSISKDPDTELDCLDCHGAGVKKPKEEPMTVDRLSHRDDPEVSHIASISLSGTNTEKVMHAVVDLLAENGPQTPAELEHLYRSRRMVNDWPQVAFYSVHKRISQMKKHIGVLRGTGIREGGAERVDLTTEPLKAHGRITAHMQDDES